MKYFVLTITLCACNFFAFSQRWQQQVNYYITVSLNDEEHTLTGFEKITYINNSPDTLRFIYFHLWQNAYKNDRTAFSEGLLKENRTDFYFSDDEDRGYVNQLNFEVNEAAAVIEETKDIDIVKLLLPKPLPPKGSAIITTPFHVKIPYNFSRGGHYKQSYQITQWYPKAALYDEKGWHPMPYTDQGEFYNDFGNYDVYITLPDNYKLGATGVLKETETTEAKKQNTKDKIQEEAKIKKPFFPSKKKEEEDITPPSSRKWKTLHYAAENVNDFAWFADKTFIVKTDTIQLATHTVVANCYYLQERADIYRNSMKFIKNAVRFYSNWMGEYPYPTVNVVDAPAALNFISSMEYPMITIITENTEEDVDITIAHEIGHNWLMAILSTNERDHAWMDEGINSYIERKYTEKYYPETEDETIKKNHLPLSYQKISRALFMNRIAVKKDQPIDYPSDAFSNSNYGDVVYDKTAEWMQQLESQLGEAEMKKIMQEYYKRFAFKHPQPEDFKQVVADVAAKDVSRQLNKINETGYLDSSTLAKKIAFHFIIPGLDEKQNSITVSPIAGYNSYDGFMIGGAIHNYQLPMKKFQFLAAPFYGTQSSTLNGTARLSFNHFTKRSWFEIAASGITYSVNSFEKEEGNTLYLNMRRIVPSAKYTLYNKDATESDKWVFQLRSFILKEDELNFTTVTTPTDTFDVVSKEANNSVINQLKVSYINNRVLYPCNISLTIDQGKEFIRAGITGNYFFNYKTKHQGLNVRVFAGKFIYTVPKTFITQFSNERYHLNLTGAKGYEDYTFSGYFIGRNEFEGFKSQQIMERDGFFKIRTDLLGQKIGKTDDWLIAANFSGDIPDNINPLNVLPFKLPVKFFLDIGTYSEAWKDNPATGRFLYDAGLQLSLFKEGINIYLPLLYSKVYSDYYKSVYPEKRFSKTISFSINLNVLKLENFTRDSGL